MHELGDLFLNRSIYYIFSRKAFGNLFKTMQIRHITHSHAIWCFDHRSEFLVLSSNQAVALWTTNAITICRQFYLKLSQNKIPIQKTHHYFDSFKLFSWDFPCQKPKFCSSFRVHRHRPDRNARKHWVWIQNEKYTNEQKWADSHWTEINSNGAWFNLI